MTKATGYPFSAALLFSVLVIPSLGCHGGGCPRTTADAREKWEADLDRRTELPLDATRDITIKRDVHMIVVAADAAKLAGAFHDVMRDPARHFGLIRVDRKQSNIGKPFQMGERFQGRYELDEAVKKNLAPWEKKVFGELVDDPGVRAWLCASETQATSDFGLIARLDLSPKHGRAS